MLRVVMRGRSAPRCCKRKSAATVVPFFWSCSRSPGPSSSGSSLTNRSRARGTRGPFVLSSAVSRLSCRWSCCCLPSGGFGTPVRCMTTRVLVLGLDWCLWHPPLSVTFTVAGRHPRRGWVSPPRPGAYVAGGVGIGFGGFGFFLSIFRGRPAPPGGLVSPPRGGWNFWLDVRQPLVLLLAP